jgi:hypothetical protein
VSSGDLTVVVLQHVTHRSLQHTRTTATTRVETSGMLAQFISRATGLDPDHANACVSQKWMKQSNRIRPAADTRDQNVRQATFSFEHLRPRFAPDHALKITHHQRIRMWTKRTAKQVVSVPNIRDPIAQSFVDRVL